MAVIFSGWMRPRTPTPTSTLTNRSPTQAAESGQSTPMRALATTSCSQRRPPDHITSAFTSWTRRRAFSTCAPTRISRLQTMHIPALRALLVWQFPRPSKTQMAPNTKWPSISTTGFSISLSTTIRSSGLRRKALLRGGLALVRPMNRRTLSFFPPQVLKTPKPAIPMMGIRGMRLS